MGDKGKYTLLLIAVLALQLFFIAMQSQANSDEEKQLGKIYNSNVIRNETLENIHAALNAPITITCED